MRNAGTPGSGLHSQGHYALLDNLFNTRRMVDCSRLFSMYGLFW